ncbi:RNA polymerase sigma factor [Chryseolinea lacunae]|uniref:Sigma-70 family RNA polymerase sigma factor n=1 Tax=Chryseolinea lacunae TaxID=2801331 RepID=A0ABS1KYU3_9BACT|nr:sigma-70 family RNA polymerase sigma factor [Chryseolinea lacunae]MBL0744629.1 sigma-70 family RNA polymerase sigma factor [Chryseolinea lacunae]
MAPEKKRDASRHGVESILFRAGTSEAQMDGVVWSLLREGQRKALDFIFEKHVRLLYAYGGKLCKDGAVVEDCIQDVFVELWNRREHLSDTDNIKFYLLKSLRRRIVRVVMAASRERTQHMLAFDDQEGSYTSIETDIVQLQTASEQQQQLTGAMQKLSKRQREAVYLKFYERMSYEQLSEVLDIDLKSSYKLIGKAIDTLRKWVRIVS